MKNILCIAILCFTGLVFSQSPGSISTTPTDLEKGSVSGTIKDLEMDGEPLMYASIELENTSWQTQSNLHGNFEVNGVAKGNYILAVSFPGYETLKIPVEIEKNDVVEIHVGLSAKSLDVGTLSASGNDTDVQAGVMGRLR